MVVCFLSMSTVAELRQKFRSVWSLLDERTRRIMAANEAESLGFGGISVVHRVCGLPRRAIAKGIREIQERVVPAEGRIRRPGATDASFRWHHPLLNFADSLGDGPSRQSAHAMHHRDASKTQTLGFVRSHDAPRALVQQRPHRPKLLPQLGNGAHAQEA